jgi:hypothetical protein
MAFAYQLLEDVQPDDGGGDDDPEGKDQRGQGQLVDPVGQEGDVREWDRGHCGWLRIAMRLRLSLVVASSLVSVYVRSRSVALNSVQV